MDFLDDETLAVANRERWGRDLQAAGRSRRRDCELSPIQVLAAGNGSLLFTPGSVSVVQGEGGRCELLICNNYADNISQARSGPQARLLHWQEARS